MHSAHGFRWRHGYTLTEVLVTLALAALLSTAAFSVARSVGASMKLAAFSNGFLAHLQLARSEAIKRRGPVVLCKSTDGTACAADGGWDQGWIVFEDANGNGTREAPEPVLQQLGGLPPGFRLQGNLNVARYVSFAPTGATRTSAGAFQAGTLTICRVSGEPTQARQIVINAVGRPRVQKLELPSCS